MRFYKLLLILVSILLLCSCQNIVGAINDAASTQPQKTDIVSTAGVIAQPEVTEPGTANSVKVGGRTFSVEEINAGIRDTLNNLWYLYGDDSTSEYISSNKDLLLGKDIEYNLYLHLGPGYASSSGIYDEASPKSLYIVITNIKPLSSTEEKPLLYTFALHITEGGVQSDFYTENKLPPESANDGYYQGHDEMIYLGHYTMRIDEVTKPQYEEMDSKWVESVTRSIKLYMDAHGGGFEPGNYHVYVKKFFKGDTDSIIFFEHENGNIYSAFYYFVHETGDYEADLNHLELDEYLNSDELYKEYYEKIKSDPAVSLEYSVKKQ